MMKEILNKILNVSNYELDQLDTSFINRYNILSNRSYFHDKAGREHYRLLMYVSKIFNKEILFDVGTYKCMSAAAMSSSMKNKVISYDIVKILLQNPILPRVQYIIGDATKDDNLINSTFIFFDVEHDGKFEKIFYEHLQNINYKGLLMCDDIHLEGPMDDWWNSIKEDKYDLTDKGHWSGTGLVNFK